MNKLQVTTEHPLMQPTVLDCYENDVLKEVAASIAKCYADTNTKIPSDIDANYLANEVKNSIIETFPSLRLWEISEAFANGIRKQYGDYYGLCQVSFEGFITGYLASEKRANLVKEKSQLSESSTEPTADEKFTMGKQLCLNLFNKYQQSKQLDRTANAVYTFLKPLDLIHKDYKVGIYKDAIEETIRLKHVDIAFCSEITKRRLLNAELEGFMDNISKDILTPDQHQEVVRTGERMILTNWFNDLIINEENFEELIEQNRNV